MLTDSLRLSPKGESFDTEQPNKAVAVTDAAPGEEITKTVFPTEETSESMSTDVDEMPIAEPNLELAKQVKLMCDILV